MVLQLLGFMTPQFIYFVIPLAALLGVLVTFGLLSRSSELSVMKACGISLYRIAAPLLLLSLVWSGDPVRPRAADPGAGERAGRSAGLADPRPAAADVESPSRRTWLVGRDGAIYHYTALRPAAERAPEPGDLPAGEDRLAARKPAVRAARRRSTAGQWIGTHRLAAGLRRRAAAGRAFASRTLALEPPDYFETQQPIAEMMTRARAEALHRRAGRQRHQRRPADRSSCRRSSPSRSSPW